MSAQKLFWGSSPPRLPQLTLTPQKYVVIPRAWPEGSAFLASYPQAMVTNSASNGTCSAPTNGTPTYTYQYDRFGNRWHQNGPNSMILTFNNESNQPDGYTFDLAGNLRGDGSHCYQYDAENRISTVFMNDCSTVVTTYICDTPFVPRMPLRGANGYRVHQTGYHSDTCSPNDGIRDFGYDIFGHQTFEHNSGGTGCRIEVYAGSRHLATYAGSEAFIHSDWLGTERFRKDFYPDQTNYQQTCSSLPFGDGFSCSVIGGGDPSPMHFTGKMHDNESGLDNFGARYNSSQMGRFMSPDPIYIEEQKMLDPQQLNLYSYVRNNPLSLGDSTGMLVDVNCSQVTSDQCKQTVADFNNRKGAQFQVTRDDKTGQLNVVGDVDPSKLSDTERALYGSITNTDATGTVTVVGNYTSFDFEKSTGKGQNSVDRSDLNVLNSADKRLSGEIISHAALESYDFAKPGVSFDQAHDLASKSFPELQYNPLKWTPFRDSAGLVAGASNRFYFSRLDIMVRARTTFKTPIPYLDWSKSKSLPPRDVTGATITPSVQ